MTALEVFTKIVNHMVDQGVKALDSFSAKCKYRTSQMIAGESKVLKCAAGCLIPDDKYELRMENYLANELVLVFDCMKVYRPFVDLIRTCQIIHDKCKPHEWSRELLDVANQHSLELSQETIDKLNNFKGA